MTGRHCRASRDAVQAYYAAVFALGRKLFGGFALALGLEENTFDALVTRPPSKLRLIHYPFDDAAQDAPGIGAHTDYECFTILLADKPGLEVMNDQGPVDRCAAAARGVRGEYRRHARSDERRGLCRHRPPGAHGERGALFLPTVLRLRLPHPDPTAAGVRPGRPGL